MATHSSILAWRIPKTGEPGGLPSMGLRRVRHDSSDLTAAAAAACSPRNLCPSFFPLQQLQYLQKKKKVWNTILIDYSLRTIKHIQGLASLPSYSFEKVKFLSHSHCKAGIAFWISNDLWNPILIATHKLLKHRPGPTKATSSTLGGWNINRVRSPKILWIFYQLYQDIIRKLFQ